MVETQLTSALRHLRGLAGGPGLAAASDRELLDLFCDRRDEPAFTQLLRRHGPMVLGVGRRLLRPEEAEDVFQATFLLLARKAASIRKRESVGCWLHGVAHHLALKARTREARRRAHERRAGQMRKPATAEAAWRELQEILDQALQGLPEHHRAVLLLCYLEGKTQEEAARQLGCPLGTVRSRLARGRKALQDHLARGGLALSAAALVAALAGSGARGAIPARLLGPTATAALRFGAGGGAAGLVPAGAAALAETGLKMMCSSKAKAVTALVLTLSLLVGAGALAQQAVADREPPAKQAEGKGPAAPPAAPADQPRVDRYGDPLPAGAVARLGSLRLYHGDSVRRAVLSPDGKLVVSVGWSAARLWDAASGRELPLDKRFHQAMFFAADGKLLATVPEKGHLFVVEVVTGKELAQFPAAAGGPLHVLSPDGKTLAYQVVATFPGGKVTPALFLSDVATGNVGNPIDLDGTELRELLFSADGKTLVAPDKKDVVHVWDVGTRAPLPSSPARPDDFGGPVALAPDGKTLATAPGRGEKIRLWDARTFKELPAPDGQPKEHAAALSFSPDGKLLAATYAGPTVRLWDLASRKEARQVQGKDQGVTSTVFSADGKTLAGADGRSVTLWDVATGQCRHDFGHTYFVNGLQFSPDGKRLATGASYTDTAVRTWDPLTGKEAARFRGHTSGIEAVAYSPDGKLLASASQDGTVRLWDLTTGQEARRLFAEHQMVYAMAFAPDGKTLASGGAQKAVHLWDVATGKELRSFDNPGAFVLRLAFSPDGKTIATRGTREGFIRLWDVAGGKEIRLLAGTGPHGLAFTPDGKGLASGDDEGAVHVWDVNTGEKGHTFALPDTLDRRRRVFCVAFAPDGRSLAAGYEDGTVRLWEVASGQERARYEGHRNGVASVAFSPDGKLLASGGCDRIAMTWDVTGRLTARRPADLTAERLSALWADLRDADAAKAYRAEQTLFGADGRAVRFLKDHLRPAAAADAKRIDRLLADLDSEEFAVRDKAAKALEQMGDAAEPALRKLLAGRPSADVRRRAEELLAGFGPAGSPEQLRGARALEVLEHVGTDEAKKLLEELARGAPEARLTREAKAALDRLKRPAAQP
jgi:RNA polymerase sigma factor (sigma-70 family)